MIPMVTIPGIRYCAWSLRVWQKSTEGEPHTVSVEKSSPFFFLSAWPRKFCLISSNCAWRWRTQFFDYAWFRIAEGHLAELIEEPQQKRRNRLPLAMSIATDLL